MRGHGTEGTFVYANDRRLLSEVMADTTTKFIDVVLICA